MNVKSSDTSTWAESLEGFSPEYTSVKCFSMLMFYTLTGRKTTLVLDNFCPTEDQKYCVYSPKEKRYYFKVYPDIPLWLIMFYDPNGAFDSYDVFLNDLRRKVDNGHVYLLFTPEQIADTTAMLTRLYKSHFTNEGKLPYKLYLELMEESLRREKYADDGKSLTGYRTCLKLFDERINAIWERAYKN